MKNNKSLRTLKFIVPAFALFSFAIFFMAFKADQDRSATNKLVNYYYFRLNSANVADENDLSKWIFVSQTTPPEDCGGSEILCSVKAPAKSSGSSYVIDPAHLQSSINMRTDPAVSEREYQEAP